MRPDPQIVVPLFMATWVALGVFSFWLMVFYRNAERKKRLMPVFIIGSGALFVLFTFLMTGAHASMLLLLVPAVFLVGFLNLRQIKTCSACGRTLFSGMWLDKAEFCAKCGARLT